MGREYQNIYHESPEVRHALWEVIEKDAKDLIDIFVLQKRKLFDWSDKDELRKAFWGFISELERKRVEHELSPDILTWSANTLAFWELQEKKIGMSIYNFFKKNYKKNWNTFFQEMQYKKDEGTVRFANAQQHWYPIVQKYYFRKFLAWISQHKSDNEGVVYRSVEDMEKQPEFGTKLYGTINRTYKNNRTAFFQAVGYDPTSGGIRFKKLKGMYDWQDPKIQRKYLFRFLEYLKAHNITNPSPSTIINWKENDESIGSMFFNGVVQRIYKHDYKKLFADFGIDPVEIGFKKTTEVTAENIIALTTELRTYLKKNYKKGWSPAVIKDWNESYYQYLLDHYRTANPQGEEDGSTKPDRNAILHDIIQEKSLIKVFSHIFDPHYKKAS